MMLTRVNQAPSPRPGFAPDAWTLGGGSTYTIGTTVGWDGQTVPCFLWAPSSAFNNSLLPPLPDLTAGDRYCWVLAVFPVGGAVRQIYVQGEVFTITTGGWQFLTGEFIAFGGGTDIFEIRTVEPYPVPAPVFVDTLLVEPRYDGDPGRYFDGALPGAEWEGIPWRSRSSLSYDMDPSTLEPLSSFPLVMVDIDARPPQSWEFVLDRSSLDGAAVLVENPRWTPLCTVSKIEIRRGRADDNAQVQAGTLHLELDNYDGLLDPDNPSSPYRPNPSETYLQRGCLIRVSSLGIANARQFTVSSLFTGRVEDWLPDIGWARTVDVTAVDDLAVVGTAAMPDFGDEPARVGDTTGDRVRWVCDQAGVPCMVSDGATRGLLPLAGGSGSLRSAADAAATAEAGRFFVDARGVAQLTVHADEYTKTPAVTLTDSVAPANRASVDYETIEMSSGAGEIVNQANIDRGSTTPDGETQTVTAADLDSVSRAGVQSVTLDAPLADPEVAQQLAEYVAFRRSRRSRRVTGLRVNVAGQWPMWAQRCVRMDLGTHVVVSRLVGYTTGARTISQRYSVERIAHSITPFGWVVEFGFSPVDAQIYGEGAGPFVLDQSSLDGPDVLTPY